jgi:hypothetical protein
MTAPATEPSLIVELPFFLLDVPTIRPTNAASSERVSSTPLLSHAELVSELMVKLIFGKPAFGNKPLFGKPVFGMTVLGKPVLIGKPVHGKPDPGKPVLDKAQRVDEDAAHKPSSAMPLAIFHAFDPGGHLSVPLCCVPRGSRPAATAASSRGASRAPVKPGASCGMASTIAPRRARSAN